MATKYFAAGANFEPPQGSPLSRIAGDGVTDLLFGSIQNDLVVPTVAPARIRLRAAPHREGRMRNRVGDAAPSTEPAITSVGGKPFTPGVIEPSTDGLDAPVHDATVPGSP